MELAKISRATLYRWVEEGILPAAELRRFPRGRGRPRKLWSASVIERRLKELTQADGEAQKTPVDVRQK